jgi:hypothetical protein
MGNRTSLAPQFLISRELDENEPIILRYDGCCRWTVSLTRCQDNTRKDCPHYSSFGGATQHWFGVDLKISHPIEFVTTWKEFMLTVNRYALEESYHKKICTIRECNTNGPKIYNCSQGKGYTW